MSEEAELRAIIQQMDDRGVDFEAGLSDAEVAEIERQGGFQFPPDLKLFLQLAMPVRWRRYRDDDGLDDEDNPFPKNTREPFPNWRDDPVEIMRWARDFSTVRAFNFDIEHNHFWMTNAWGEKPETLDEQLLIAGHYLKSVPLLIPIHIHRMIPAEPCEAGNPVFSIWQAVDSIYYGRDLQDYLRHEFINREEYDYGKASDYRHIRFWSDIIQK